MLRTTHRSTVTEDQIDELGHMNVRFYARDARAATRTVIGSLDGWPGSDHRLVDTYTRHHREQLLGAELEVRSGILDVVGDELVLHHELANRGTGELAATFIHRVVAIGDGATAGLSDQFVETVLERRIDLPEHARPRSIDPHVDLVTTVPEVDVLESRNLATHLPRVVPDEDCDADGHVKAEGLPSLVWGGVRIDESDEGPVIADHEGRNLAWAAMENRFRILRPVRRGMTTRAYGCGIALHDKVGHGLRWVVDESTREVLVVFETISLAFDIDRRRPASIPEPTRSRLLDELHTDLAPTARLV